MSIIRLVLFFLLCFPYVSQSTHIQAEKEYQNEWCLQHNGVSEYMLPDKTRCDCLTNTHAIEFDFAQKFYEALGQSLYYSLQTNKRSGIVLILEKQKDNMYWLRLNSIIEHFNLPIDTWKIENY